MVVGDQLIFNGLVRLIQSVKFVRYYFELFLGLLLLELILGLEREPLDIFDLVLARNVTLDAGVVCFLLRLKVYQIVDIVPDVVDLFDVRFEPVDVLGCIAILLFDLILKHVSCLSANRAHGRLIFFNHFSFLSHLGKLVNYRTSDNFSDQHNHQEDVEEID